jgi:hypothetical protein
MLGAAPGHVHSRGRVIAAMLIGATLILVRLAALAA